MLLIHDCLFILQSAWVDFSTTMASCTHLSNWQQLGNEYFLCIWSPASRWLCVICPKVDGPLGQPPVSQLFLLSSQGPWQVQWVSLKLSALHALVLFLLYWWQIKPSQQPLYEASCLLEFHRGNNIQVPCGLESPPLPGSFSFYKWVCWCREVNSAGPLLGGSQMPLILIRFTSSFFRLSCWEIISLLSS